MSTERKQRINQLVQDIQNGETSKFHALWDEVERLIAYWADKYAAKNLSGAVFEDLYQCGYIAMCRAVETHNGAGSFPHWLYYHYKTEVAALTGYRTKRQRNDPLRNAVSLNAPVNGESDETMLEDTIPDPQDAYEDIEREICNEQLRAALERQLDAIRPECAAVIREHYMQGKTFESISAERGCSTQWARQLENKGIRLLRKPWRINELREFIELTTPYYRHVGVERFLNTGVSATEYAVLYREHIGGGKFCGWCPVETNTIK